MPASFFEALEFLDWLRAGFAGWRYFLSASFRRATNARWEQQGRGFMVWEIVGVVSRHQPGRGAKKIFVADRDRRHWLELMGQMVENFDLPSWEIDRRKGCWTVSLAVNRFEKRITEEQSLLD